MATKEELLKEHEFAERHPPGGGAYIRDPNGGLQKVKPKPASPEPPAPAPASDPGKK
ncbi:MAG TPA: hypothetical protein VFB13_00735 [Reyranella sp.]|jgi:hypothetical protein|nr:hypothetical protein [Reyranella sp.]